MKDRKKYDLENTTISLWSYLNSQKEKYYNPFYLASNDIDIIEIFPNTNQKFLRLWTEYFFYYISDTKDEYKIYAETEFTM